MDTGIVIGIVGIILTVASFFFAKVVRNKTNSVKIEKSKLANSNIVFGDQTNEIKVKRNDT